MDISLLADHPQHVPLIAKWYLSEWGHMMKEEDANLSFLEQKIRLGLNRDEVPMCILAHQNNELMGVAELKFRKLTEFPNKCHWLDGVYVPPVFRGKGISSKLIAEAINRAKNNQIQSLNLRCEIHNIALYEKYGFSVVERENIEGKSKAIMVLELSQ